MNQPIHSPYDAIARVYDWLGWFYSAGAIGRAKNSHLPYLKRGDEVLYVGAGTGTECVRAAALGVQVTAVDTSSAMLARLSARFTAAGEQANVVCGDVLDLDGSFDAIVAPFFFNVFSPAQLEQAMNRLSKHLKPNGLLVSVDFHAPSNSAFVRMIQKCYYLPPLALFHLATQNPWHELYDYRQIAQQARVPVAIVETIPTKAFGLPLFETLIWKGR